MPTTALTIITNAVAPLNVFMAGDTIPNADAQSALNFLNLMIGSLALQGATIPSEARLVFPLVSGQGGPSNPYSIGLTGTFVTTKPAKPDNISGAGVLLGATTPAVEMPRAVLNDEQYEAIRIKELQTSLFTYVYYNATVANALGTIQLWPVPNSTVNSLVLYLKQPLAAFTSLSASYEMPLGFEEALTYNLERRLATVFGRTMPPDDLDLAKRSLMYVKTSTAQLTDLPIDPMFVPTSGARKHGYNILTGR